jgi:sugar lactone lactonase YvrE
MSRLRLVLLLAATVTASAAGSPGAAFPSRIDLPAGFRPEGIAISGNDFYVGSIPTGAVYRGSLRTGEGAVVVPPHEGRASIGLKVDRGRIFVAGGPTGMAFVNDARTGADLASYALTSEASFINDVVVTKDAAWFTDSSNPVLYRIPLGPGGKPGPQSAVEPVELGGDYVHAPGEFNLNGIDATPNGKLLLAVQSFTGKLFAITPDGEATEIALAGGESVPNGDGILLVGKTLYVVQNQLDLVAQIELSPDFRSGVVVTRIGEPEPGALDVPTTIARHGSSLYVVNARFSTPPTPTTEYWITKLAK